MAKLVKAIYPCVGKFLLRFPKRYTFLDILGEGAFGWVLKCYDKQTKCKVAVKILKFKKKSNYEVSVLEKLMSNNLGKSHIVEYYNDSFITDSGEAMVFELLDISLHDYILKNTLTPMPLSDIRAVVEQIAIALGALKDIKLIHCDIKPANIMLVNQQRHPLQVKLIDFGSALPTKQVKRGMIVQSTAYRSPEVILGLPFSEAIDMWSLGCVMARMITGNIPFPGWNRFEAMQFIVELLGPPAVHLLELGKYTKKHFIRTESGEWQFKCPSVHQHYIPPIRCYKFPPLDYLRKVKRKMGNITEAEEWEQCIDLLKAMLEMDPRKRITPSEVLKHPFINHMAWNHDSSNLQVHKSLTPASPDEESEKKNSDQEPPATALSEDVTHNQTDHHSPSLTDQAGLNKVSESSVKVTEIQETALMSKDANPGEAKQAKKKRKTIRQRVVSCVRRNIWPKRVSPLVDEGKENL